jgi:hypothetical protein
VKMAALPSNLSSGTRSQTVSVSMAPRRVSTQPFHETPVTPPLIQDLRVHQDIPGSPPLHATPSVPHATEGSLVPNSPKESNSTSSHSQSRLQPPSTPPSENGAPSSHRLVECPRLRVCVDFRYYRHFNFGDIYHKSFPPHAYTIKLP